MDGITDAQQRTIKRIEDLYRRAGMEVDPKGLAPFLSTPISDWHLNEWERLMTLVALNHSCQVIKGLRREE